MKIKIYITFMVFILFSCIREGYKDSPLLETSGVIYVNILEQNGSLEDKIESIRFFVFKDASGSPKLELNKFVEIPPVTSGEVSKLEIVLEVSRKLSGNNEKIIIAIANEPLSMMNVLDQINDLDALANLELDLAGFLNNNHNSLQEGKTMPMTGVLWTNRVHETISDAQIDPAKMSLLRAVARIDIYIRKESNTDYDLGINSEIILENTYSKEYFVRNHDGENTFGKIQTVTSGFITKSWHATTPANIPNVTGSNNGLFLCTFYTPERMCEAPGNIDKLILDIDIVSSIGEHRTGIAIFDEFYLDNVKTTINSIERNNLYRVILTVRDKEIIATATVLDWDSEDFEIEL